MIRPTSMCHPQSDFSRGKQPKIVPAKVGLGAGITAGKLGLGVVIIDENHNPGGQFIKQIHKFFGSQEEYAGLTQKQN